MSIITQTNLADRLGAAELIRLTDDAGSAAVNTAVMDRAIDEGEGEILNNLGQKYTLPLVLTDANSAAVVRAKCLDAVVYRLVVHRDRVVDESLLAAYKAAVAWSERIATGALGLIGETLTGSSPAPGGAMLIVGGEQVIDRESMKGL